jgi:hypothetical protein
MEQRWRAADIVADLSGIQMPPPPTLEAGDARP